MLRVLAILACIWASEPGSVNGDTDADDVSALNVLYSSMNSPGQLTGWNASGGDPCGQSWRGVKCSGSAVTEVKLSGLGLNGNLGYQLDKMKSLIELDLSNNNLGAGNTIPYNLPPHLQQLNLAQNQFNGGIPYSISQMAALQKLNLAHNQLRDSLSDMFVNLVSLGTMDLSFNFITGDLPESFSSLSSLTILYLQNNQFTGPIDVLAILPLNELNVANNRFTGWIPNQLKGIDNLKTDGNSWNSGPAPPPPPYTSPPGIPSNPVQAQGSGGSNNPSDGGGKSSGIGGGGIAGIIISILVVGAVIAFFLLKRKTRKFSREDHLEQDQPFASLASNAMFKSATDATTFQPTSASLKSPPTSRQNKSYEEDELSKRMPVMKEKAVPIRKTMYSVADLQLATNSFSLDNLIGEGSLGRVYRAQFADGKVFALKKINTSSLSRQSYEGFIELVSSISRLSHPNISELVGYCSEHGQHLLVYEFHKNGSLQDLLHLVDEDSNPLSWNTRVKIALGIARALEYLHEVCSPSVVHKNFNSANILMDAELNPHVSECGLACLIPNADYRGANHNLASGYNAPEVDMFGQYTLKSDVYSFGVVMLELLTGRKPFDSSRPRSEQHLVRWATPQLHDIDALDKMVDPQLQGLYPAKSLSRFADVIAICVQPEPEFRPPMSEVVQALVRLVQRANVNQRVLAGDAQDAIRRTGNRDA
ncbi:protein STRUBBELIG-RECEPTOR FAMILY 7 isoform X2 [Phalaenopsis equestris]|uniref:protein STRUBBELIG-RECEPTOR FAMILY 7 isoform X2 n=1 Tax=Phalaenopsis equestris TaxID=78828 RepID=UPI0009E4F3AD|nr:protein STRUBBELIG-RECEPTOR FAMILY 7 isoform X2 [Phalaenopsis equestris]